MIYCLMIIFTLNFVNESKYYSFIGLICVYVLFVSDIFTIDDMVFEGQKSGASTGCVEDTTHASH